MKKQLFVTDNPNDLSYHSAKWATEYIRGQHSMYEKGYLPKITTTIVSPELAVHKISWFKKR